MESHETPEVNQASGNSIFWALVALALNAMTEPSRIGTLLRPRSGSGTATNSDHGLDPLRSSPVLCAAETILDMFFFIVEPKPHGALSSTNAAPNAPYSTEHRPPAVGQSPDVLPAPGLATTHHSAPSTDNTAPSKSTLKFAAFFLGVVPQTIKLFSMRGIVGTQICAAMFLATSVTQAISCKSSSHFAASIDILKDIDIYTAPRLLLLLSTYIAHIVVYIWLYVNIAAGLLNNAAAAGAGDHSVNIPSELARHAKFVYLLFGLLTVIFNLVWRRSLPLSKWLPLIVSLFLPDTGTSTTRHAESGTRILSQAIALVALSIIGCLQVSALCIASGRVLARLAAKRAAHSGGHSDGSLPTTSTHADGPASMGRFHVTNTLRQGIVGLKSILLRLCKAVDNHGEWLETWHEGFGMSTEQFVLASGIFNLLSVVLYYLVVFDSTGTSSPSWTTALG